MDKKTALMTASGFGGGLGRLREVCGAVSGMVMVLNHLYGNHDISDKAAKDYHYARVQELLREFEAENHSIICRELLSGVKTKPGNEPEERTKEYYATRPCLRHVGEAAMIVDELLREAKAIEK